MDLWANLLGPTKTEEKKNTVAYRRMKVIIQHYLQRAKCKHPPLPPSSALAVLFNYIRRWQKTRLCWLSICEYKLCMKLSSTIQILSVCWYWVYKCTQRSIKSLMYKIYYILYYISMDIKELKLSFLEDYTARSNPLLLYIKCCKIPATSLSLKNIHKIISRLF